jgi:hypothetical protein
MRMGATQNFDDYLQDFEFKLSQCDDLMWPDRTKIIYLNTSINNNGRHTQDAPEKSETPKVDHDGDTLMTGVSGLSISNLATFINATQGNRNRGSGRGRNR